MIPRLLQGKLVQRSREYPIVTLLGPRQAGKTTLVKAAFPDFRYANLENPEQRKFALTDPKGFLKANPCPLVIDEIQRVPELLSWIQVGVDAAEGNGRFILTGSNQPELGAAVAQSLAGRTSLLKLLPLSLEELASYGVALDRDRCLVQGFLPRVHQEKQPATQAYLDYLATYVERDLRQLINVKEQYRFEVFLRLLAGRVGQLLNLSALAADTGVSSTTLGHWLSVLEASFIVFRLSPYHGNLGKRLVKNPKLYFYEPGLVAALLQVETTKQASRDPLLGGMFENMIVVEVLKSILNRGRHDTMTFYRDSNGNEVDIIIERQRIPHAIEIKASRTFTPDFLRSLRHFKELLPETGISNVVYGGNESMIGDDYRVWGFAETFRAIEC
jgi:predicted AAA+ superfamily ATPase